MIQPERRVFAVGELLDEVSRHLRSDFSRLYVDGEISNYKQHSSGHCYFSLGDSTSQVRCVMWASTRRRVRFNPENGLQVRVRADVSIYAARGDLQLLVQGMAPAGEGEFQKAFIALKNKLEKEGLFDSDCKRELPAFPETIGVITSGEGAAIHDILSVLERRFPIVRVLRLPVAVQGPDSGRQIQEAIELFNAETGTLRPDLMIVGRGGGSVEDLWAFNEERVARAIFASAIPIVSAVGHETDFSIADFVADVRAATPSMAAEVAVPDRNELLNILAGLASHLGSRMQTRLDASRRTVEALGRSHALGRLPDRIERDVMHVRAQSGRLVDSLQSRTRFAEEKVRGLTRALVSLDPDRPLARGFARITKNGAPVAKAADLSIGDHISLTLSDGSRKATVDG